MISTSVIVPVHTLARNAGARVARGRFFLFVDADDALAAGYVEHMTRALADHQWVTSRVDSTSLNPEWVFLAHREPWQAETIGVFFDFLPATGINIGIHRSDYGRLGGFSGAFSGSEDIAFSWKAYKAGLRLHRYPRCPGVLPLQGQVHPCAGP